VKDCEVYLRLIVIHVMFWKYLLLVHFVAFRAIWGYLSVSLDVKIRINWDRYYGSANSRKKELG